MTDFLSAENARIHALGGKFSDNWGMPGNSTFSVNSEAEMLKLFAVKGDVAVRSDINRSFRLRQLPAAVIGNWQEMLSPADIIVKVISQNPYNVLPTDKVLITSLSDTHNFILPSAVGIKSPIKIILNPPKTNFPVSVRIHSQAPQTINRLLSIPLRTGTYGGPANHVISSADLISDGANWWIPISSAVIL